MSKLSFYIDGSEVPINNTVRQGWGIVARRHNGQTNEFNGYVVHSLKSQGHRGYYELMAFYHAVNHAEEQGLYPEDVSFYTDCSWVAYAGFHLVKTNYSRERVGTIERLQRFQRMFCPKDKHAVMKLIRWLGLAQVHWIKGHKKIIDNCRADHLARMAVRERPIVPFDKWLSLGFANWDNVLGGMDHWYPPFVKAEKNV